MAAITLASSTLLLAIMKLGPLTLLLTVRKLFIHSFDRHWLINHMLISASPPTPGRPFEIKAQSTSITVGWSESSCVGGHPITSFDLQYDQLTGYFIARTIRNIDPTQRNYTVTGLQSSRFYTFRVRSVSVNSRTSSYSSSASIATLAPGML